MLGERSQAVDIFAPCGYASIAFRPRKSVWGE